MGTKLRLIGSLGKAVLAGCLRLNPLSTGKFVQTVRNLQTKSGSAS